VRYTLSFPSPSTAGCRSTALVSGRRNGTLELPNEPRSGAYSLHDFAKNVYDVHAFAADGRELHDTSRSVRVGNVAGHAATSTVKYKCSVDRVDGPTSRSTRRTHTSNMPAAIMWAHGLDEIGGDRPFRGRPAGCAGRWRRSSRRPTSGVDDEFGPRGFEIQRAEPSVT